MVFVCYAVKALKVSGGTLQVSSVKKRKLKNKTSVGPSRDALQCCGNCGKEGFERIRVVGDNMYEGTLGIQRPDNVVTSPNSNKILMYELDFIQK